LFFLVLGKMEVNSQPDDLQLPEGGDFEALHCHQAETLIEAQSLI
jgi:hypothetical protein